MNSCMKLTVDRRRLRGCQHSDYWVSREAYKRRVIRPHPLITVPHPLLSLLESLTLYRGNPGSCQ